MNKEQKKILEEQKKILINRIKNSRQDWESNPYTFSMIESIKTTFDKNLIDYCHQVLDL